MEGDISSDQVSELLSNMVAKLKVLKRKVRISSKRFCRDCIKKNPKLGQYCY